VSGLGEKTTLNALAAQVAAKTEAGRVEATRMWVATAERAGDVASVSFWVFVTVSSLLSLCVLSVGMRFLTCWYVITSERICIQSGVFARTIVTLDLDKILSLKATSGWLERRLGLQNIEFVHGGASELRSRSPWNNPYVMCCLDESEGVLSRLSNEWLPRDNRARSA
jgi:membrane protein YdbS with pleckstrin-like domain